MNTKAQTSFLAGLRSSKKDVEQTVITVMLESLAPHNLMVQTNCMYA